MLVNNNYFFPQKHHKINDIDYSGFFLFIRCIGHVSVTHINVFFFINVFEKYTQHGSTFTILIKLEQLHELRLIFAILNFRRCSCPYL